MSDSLSDQLQVWGFDGDRIVYADGSVGFAIECKPLDATCWDEREVAGFSDKVLQFLNAMPSGLDIQFIQDITHGNADLIERHRTGGTPTSEVVRELTEARAKRLIDLDESGQVPRHLLKIVVRKAPQSALLEKPKFFSKAKRFESMAESKLTSELDALERIKSDLIAGLGQLGMDCRSIGVEELMDILYVQWNPSRGISRPGFDADDVRGSLLFSDVGIYDRGFSIGDYHYRVVSLKLLPDQTFMTMAACLRTLPFGSRYQLTIHVPDQQKELEALQLQRRVTYSMIAGQRSGVSDLDSEAKFRDLEGLLEQMVSQGEKVFHFSVQIILKAKSNEELDDLVSGTLLKFRELGGAEGMEESLAAFDIFSESALPNARSKERSKRIKSSNLADILPVFGPWPGHSNPRILLRSRMGSLVSFDPFSSDLTNSNQIVSGGSGSGKSFLSNVLLMHMLKEEPKAFVVDVGGSYKKLCENFDGQYIPFGVDTALSMNPFDLGHGEEVPSNHKIKFLLSLVEIMTKEDGDTRLGKLERAEIEEAIQEVYRTSKNPRLSDLKSILLKNTDPQVARYGKILAPWCGETPYGRFVDHGTTLKLDRNLVCFDLKGLEALPDLQAICLFIITDFVWREVQADRSRMKFLILDECWKLLVHESSALFIAEVFRTFRKYMASAIAISQNIDDFAKSKVATAILPNSSIKWILRQKGADQERLREVLSLNESESALVASLHQERGVYSEAFLMCEDQRTVVAIESTPLEYWLATTDPRDLGHMDSEKAKNVGLSNLDLLKRLALNYPRGMAAAGGAK
jgi:conjugal transfer ATP-binding protein TraC